MHPEKSLNQRDTSGQWRNLVAQKNTVSPWTGLRGLSEQHSTHPKVCVLYHVGMVTGVKPIIHSK